MIGPSDDLCNWDAATLPLKVAIAADKSPLLSGDIPCLPAGWEKIQLGGMRLLVTPEFPGKVWLQHPDGVAGHFDAVDLGELIKAYFEEEY